LYVDAATLILQPHVWDSVVVDTRHPPS